MSAPIFWLTGLSGSGKSTIANLAKDYFISKNLKVRIVDGDDVRDQHPRKLGFSPEDIKLNNELIARICQSERSNVDLILVPVISPLEEIRRLVRGMLEPEFYLLYCNANLESVIKRDVKGLYKKAQEGIISDMIGFAKDYPYQIPQDADLVLNTSGSEENEKETLIKAIEFINSKLRLS